MTFSKQKGAVYGGILGSLVGGPFGAAAGVAIGAWIASSRENELLEIDAEVENTTTAIYYSLPMLGKMASADGHVDQVEIEIITDFARSILGDSEGDIQEALEKFKESLDDNKTIYDYADSFKERVVSREDREAMYKLLFYMAYADDVLDPKEDEILKAIPKHLAIFSYLYDDLKSEFESNKKNDDNGIELSTAYHVLDCTPTSSDDEVKKAWRKKCLDFHPDKLASKGLHKSFIKFAHEQMQLINDAYNMIKNERLK